MNEQYNRMNGLKRRRLLVNGWNRWFSILAVNLAMVGWSNAATKPNVVIIYGDDIGYGDVGAYGCKMIPTPNIDRLAEGGLRFTDGHSPAATCSPSRYAMMTGIHGFRDGVHILPPNSPLTISTEALTLPKLFKQAGYVTGLVGKWHLGLGGKDKALDWNGKIAPGPLEVGFDSSFMLPTTNDRVPSVYVDGHHVLNLDPNDPLYVGNNAPVDREGSTRYPDGRKNRDAMTFYQSSHGHNNSVINGIGRIGYMAGGKSALWDDETIADVFVKKATEFIAKHKEEPFFLFFSSQDIHVPRAPNPRFKGKSKLGYRGDAMVQFDWATGEIMKALDEHGLAENTLVVFSGDNGAVYDDGYKDGTTVKTSTKEEDRGHDATGIYRGGKGQIYEGGTRVPFVVRWPARIKPGVSHALVNQVDFIASFAALLDLDVPTDQAVDSRDTLAALLGEDQKGLPFMIEESPSNVKALRSGDWKYIKFPKKEELYDLKKDPSEKKNVIQEHPEVAKSLADKLQNLIDAGRVK